MHKKIINLYKRYGFQYRDKQSNKNFLSFTFKSGFFHNAEIVSLKKNEQALVEKEMNQVVTQLEQLGFATKKRFYDDITEIETTLFEGFFNVSIWKKQIKQEYEEHCQKILNILPKEAVNYSYIQVPYLKNGKMVDEDLIENINLEILKSGPQLNIIEAPAGFGKTCTSYEIIRRMVENCDVGPLPFFTEFSRDRQARVFNHILIREVDRSFSSVNSSVVIDEIKKGKIVVVLDGFDELLHDTNLENNEKDKFENAEPMLETIGELLTNNAKIILTSRRSAILDGERFSDWVAKYEENFSINRYRLDRPEAKDWLVPSRLEVLNDSSINISNLSNPVLLSYLRFMDDVAFEKLCETPGKIVNKYFSSMLDREMERQELRMSAEQQTEMLSLVANDMCDNNYTADSKEKIISIIKDKGSGLLNEVRKLYPPKDRPTLDKLAVTLSNHAFFDRANQDEDSIHFINEFVFGNYIAENILTHSDWLASDERFVEPAVLSYQARDSNSRLRLWSQLATMKDFLEPTVRMQHESTLTKSIKEDFYSNVDINKLNIESIDFFRDGTTENSIYNECTFKKIHFIFDNFYNVTFLNCMFWDCSFEVNEEVDVSFYNCKDNNNIIENVESLEVFEDSTLHENISYYIFSRVWPIGSPSIERLHYFTSNLFKTDEFSRKEINKEIKRLRQEDFLLNANDINFVTINKSKIAEIKKILGRS